MKKQFKTSLFIFRRDLRLDDNTALIAALQNSDKVIPCFIFDPRQVGKQNNYRSANAIQFMIESIKSVNGQLQKKKGKLYIFYGEPKKIINALVKKHALEAVFCNKDYTPFSIKRDNEIKHICNKNNAEFIQHNDLLLNEPENIKTGNGTPYTVFTAFFKKTSRVGVQKPQKNNLTNYFTGTIKGSQSQTIYKKVLPKNNNQLHSNGGRNESLSILKKINHFEHYNKTHDIPTEPTTNLAPHLKFGTISIREAYHAIAEKLGKGHPLIRQLYWRDFFTHVTYHSPFVFGHAYHEKYDKLWWENDAKKFKAWCNGTTGFPIVDAGMRQLNTTGFMHNRVRMIVGSFLVKDLHIDWRKGEKYFAQQLVDYDPAVNNGNWQWVASTGCDAQPYFRIFNPWLQQKKFDTQARYIKQWVPELKNVEPKIIHTLFKENIPAIKGYSRPIVNHEEESKKAKEVFRKVKS